VCKRTGVEEGGIPSIPTMSPTLEPVTTNSTTTGTSNDPSNGTPTITSNSNVQEMNGTGTIQDKSKVYMISSTARPTHKKPSRKRTSPFRIKTGCIVACRINSHLIHNTIPISMTIKSKQQPLDVASSNQRNDDDGDQNQIPMQKRSSASSDTNGTTTTSTKTSLDFTSFQMVWTNPIPHRDLFWSLIGKRIRCSVSTCPIQQQQKQCISSSVKNKALEGEVIRLLLLPNPNSTLYQSIELLVDEKVLHTFPYLRRVDTVSDMDGSSKEAIIRRRYELEQHIANGGDKNKKLVTVQVTLLYPSYNSGTTTSRINDEYDNNNSNDTNNDTTRNNSNLLIIQNWVIQKCIPTNFVKKKQNNNINKNKRSYQNRNNHIDSLPGNEIISKKLDTNKESQNGTSITYESEKHNSSNIGQLSEPSLDNGTININHSNQNKNKFIKTSVQRSMGNDANKNIDTINGDSIINNISNTNNKEKNTVTTNNKNNNNNNKSTTKYIGDGYDVSDQQIRNWRWFACRYHDILFKSQPKWGIYRPNIATRTTLTTYEIDSVWVELLSAGFIGEVVKIDTNTATPNNDTLAMVTIRLMLLPEHTVTGRTTAHKWNEMLVDYDTMLQQESSVEYGIFLNIPIEQLVIIIDSKSINKKQTEKTNHVIDDTTMDDVIVQYAYSRTHHIYFPYPLERSTGQKMADSTGICNVPYCHRCHRTTNTFVCDSVKCQLKRVASVIQNNLIPNSSVAWCKECVVNLTSGISRDDSDTILLPCCNKLCDCYECNILRQSDAQDKFYTKLIKRTRKRCSNTKDNNNEQLTNNDVLLFTATVLSSMDDKYSINFGLSNDFMNISTLPTPHLKPNTRKRQRTICAVKQHRRSSNRPTNNNISTNRESLSKGKISINTANKLSSNGKSTKDSITVAALKRPLLLKKNHCAREIVYQPSMKYSYKTKLMNGEVLPPMEKARSVRKLNEASTRRITEQKDESAKTSSSSRAARANQRRMLKDVASLVVAAPSYSGFVDTLSNREPQLRFDRSKIHAWGVFADTAISAGEMIVEYRGELIGNAVAERREIEYEDAKIGSDYMFRIDALNVCDATKQGNVARFINASCDPNCYTKIINFDGSKRIVIYAKKDIQAGEELCYDYKFPLEYDESKRIPCRCGARDCRGFMNWVSKKKVV
jgi:[histone H3]-lysine4 N-trimethyltransferase SETD1